VHLDLYSEQEVTIGGSLEAANDFFPATNANYIEVACDPCPTVDADYNYWGFVEPDSFRARFTGEDEAIDFEPWTDAGHENLYYLSQVGVEEVVDYQPGVSLMIAGENPTRGELGLWFALPASARATLTIYDVRGRRVRTLIDDRVGAGRQYASIDTRGLTSGVYFARLLAADRTEVRRFVVLK